MKAVLTGFSYSCGETKTPCQIEVYPNIVDHIVCMEIRSDPKKLGLLEIRCPLETISEIGDLLRLILESENQKGSYTVYIDSQIQCRHEIVQKKASKGIIGCTIDNGECSITIAYRNYDNNGEKTQVKIFSDFTWLAFSQMIASVARHLQNSISKLEVSEYIFKPPHIKAKELHYPIPITEWHRDKQIRLMKILGMLSPRRTLKHILEEIEIMYLKESQKRGLNQRDMAGMLGIERTTFIEKLKRFDLLAKEENDEDIGFD